MTFDMNVVFVSVFRVEMSHRGQFAHAASRETNGKRSQSGSVLSLRHWKTSSRQTLEIFIYEEYLSGS